MKNYPAYLNLGRKELKKRIDRAFCFLEKCSVCPRKCGANRLKGEKGFCQLGKEPMVSSYHPHFGEEFCLVGEFGSGTIFLAYCNLACVFCQNYDISQLGYGKEVSLEELAEMMISLQERGCHNINLVTPTPQVPQILGALLFAIEKGLKIPLVYNSNGYDSIESLKLLDGIVDIYMPDTKYADNKIALKYSNVPIFYSHGPIRPEQKSKILYGASIPRPSTQSVECSVGLGYWHAMKNAVKEMYRQVGDLIFDEKGIALCGLLVRHLVLPNNLAGTKEIMEFLAKEISPNTFVNVMDQYRPCWKANQYPPLDRPITFEEYQEARGYAKKAGLKRIYPYE